MPIVELGEKFSGGRWCGGEYSITCPVCGWVAYSWTDFDLCIPDKVKPDCCKTEEARDENI